MPTDLSPSTTDATSRRRLLTVLGAGGAALVATLLPRSGALAGHDSTNTMHLGEANSANAPTVLSADVPTAFPADPDPRALSVFIPQGRALSGHSSFGVGVVGHSENGAEPNPPVGVEGTAHNDGIGIRGESKAGEGEGPGAGPGVVGSSGSGPGVEGSSEVGFGVAGFSGGSNPGGVGVFGGSPDDVGVFGVSASGTEDPPATGDGVGGFSQNSVGGRFGSNAGVGLRAVSPGDDKPALEAASGTVTGPHFEPTLDGKLALEVIGKARFSTAGKGTVPAGADSVEVTGVPVTPDSHVTVTLSSEPGGRQLHWVEKGGGTFTVHLTAAPPPQRPATDFTYLIVESPTQA